MGKSVPVNRFNWGMLVLVTGTIVREGFGVGYGSTWGTIFALAAAEAVGESWVVFSKSPCGLDAAGFDAGKVMLGGDDLFRLSGMIGRKKLNSVDCVIAVQSALLLGKSTNESVFE